MIEPSLDKLIDLVDSKYTLVVLSSKRAREIVDDDVQTGGGKGKPVTLALQEIFARKVGYERTKTGIK